MTIRGPIEYAIEVDGKFEYQCGCLFMKDNEYWFWEHCISHGGSIVLELKD